MSLDCPAALPVAASTGTANLQQKPKAVRSCLTLTEPFKTMGHGTHAGRVQRTKLWLPQQWAQHVLPKPGTSRLVCGGRPSATTNPCATSLLLLHGQGDDWGKACELQPRHALHAGQGGRIQAQAFCRCKLQSSQPASGWLLLAWLMKAGHTRT